jgi:hypothetical protein
VSRLLTPAEIEALRAADSFVPAPSETFHVTVEAGTAALEPAAVAALEPGSLIPIRTAKPGLVEIVANGFVVAYGRLEESDGALSVRVMQLAPRGGATGAEALR